MKMELTTQQVALKDEFRLFVDNKIIPYAAQNDKEEKIHPEIIKKIAEKGYLGSMISTDYGGTSWDMVTIGLLNEEMGRACSSVRGLLTVHGMVSLAISRWGTKKQAEYYLPKMTKGELIGAFALTEPDIGSDAKNVKSVAVQVENGYVINGTKKWITMGQIADVFLIIAQCEGKPTAFLMERDTVGLSITPIKGLLGARASMVAQLNMKDCFIKKENIIGNIGTGLSHIAQASLNYGRYTIACGCVGAAQGCLELSIKYSRNRKQFGAPLRENQLIQKMITEMVVNIKAARYMYYSAGYLNDVGDPDYIMETWTAKYFASKVLCSVASDAVQIHGANGCCSDYPIERYYRDAKINEIIEGTSQMHEVLIAINAIRSY